MPSPLEQWYFQIPPVTRFYITAVCLLTIATQFGWVSWFQLFYNYEYTFYKGQYWRLLTTFLYFGNFSLDWLLNMYFVIQYSRDLEEGSFLNRPADFFWLLILVCSTLLGVASIADITFLASPLNFTLTYIWARQYSYMAISFLGLFTFSAPYLPWVMAGFSSLVGNRWPVSDMVGIAVGHVFWFLEEEWPRRPESGGCRILKAPRALCRFFGQDVDEEEGEGEPVDIPALQPERAVGEDTTAPQMQAGSDLPPAYGETPSEKPDHFASLSSSWEADPAEDQGSASTSSHSK